MQQSPPNYVWNERWRGVACTNAPGLKPGYVRMVDVADVIQLAARRGLANLVRSRACKRSD